jgi:hypothetical protein
VLYWQTLHQREVITSLTRYNFSIKMTHVPDVLFAILRPLLILALIYYRYQSVVQTDAWQDMFTTSPCSNVMSDSLSDLCCDSQETVFFGGRGVRWVHREWAITCEYTGADSWCLIVGSSSYFTRLRSLLEQRHMPVHPTSTNSVHWSRVCGVHRLWGVFIKPRKAKLWFLL